MSDALDNAEISLGLIRKACADEGGVMPSFRDLSRSTSSNSTSSMSSPRARSTWLISSLARASLSGVSRMVIARLCESSSMCVEPVISRRMRSNSVISSGATADASGNVCSACTAYCRRFSGVSGVTKISDVLIGRQNVPVCWASRVIAVAKSTPSTRSFTLRAVRSGSKATLMPKVCATWS